MLAIVVTSFMEWMINKSRGNKASIRIQLASWGSGITDSVTVTLQHTHVHLSMVSHLHLYQNYHLCSVKGDVNKV